MKRGLRLAFHAASVITVLAAFFVVPMPVASFAPGAATEIAPLLEVEGHDDELDGSLRLLSVFVAQPSMFGVLRGGIDDRIDLLPREEVFPSNIRRVDFQAQQREDFRTAFRIAAGVGMAAAGLEVTITTAARVADVLDGGPAAGVLLPGDVITSLDGTTVTSSGQLVELAGTSVDGQVLELGIRRNDQDLVREVVAGELPGGEQVGIGISVGTVEEDLVLPLEVELVDQQRIGGPSAGLMVALTVYDLVADENLTDGRVVAGTGTIDGEGRVGRIGGMREKTFAAMAAGVDVLLVPESQAAEARAVADGSLVIVGVTTFDEALAALR